jgi:pyruvate carboxylase subunit B
LPAYEIFIDGKPRRIELTKTGENSFTVEVDHKPLSLELQADRVDLEKAFSIKIDAKTYKIELPRIDWGKLFAVKVEGVAFKAELKTPPKKQTLTPFETVASTPMSTRKTAVVTKQAVEGAITAPMTGKILSVKVKKGDQVKLGQVVCVLEAMKMENEITAPKAGIVREVFVSEGSSVSEGEPLLQLD